MPTVGAKTDDPEAEAQELLHTVWGGPRLPVDPIYIAQRLGVQTFKAGLDRGISGMLVKRPGQDPVIYLNSSDSISRQRFTCAHELGHYVKRIAAGEEDWEHIDHRDALSASGTDQDEIFANRFAASLLMPRDEVKRLKRQYGPAALAYEFGVSEDAMSFRLANLNLA